MGIISKIKDIFFKKEEVVEAPVESQEKPLEEPIAAESTENLEECFDCKEPIYSYQKARHYGGHSYHKECLRKLIKKAKQFINS